MYSVKIYFWGCPPVKQAKMGKGARPPPTPYACNKLDNNYFSYNYKRYKIMKAFAYIIYFSFYGGQLFAMLKHFNKVCQRIFQFWSSGSMLSNAGPEAVDILVRSDCTLKILDFGLARSAQLALNSEKCRIFCIDSRVHYL